MCPTFTQFSFMTFMVAFEYTKLPPDDSRLSVDGTEVTSISPDADIGADCPVTLKRCWLAPFESCVPFSESVRRLVTGKVVPVAGVTEALYET